MAGRSFSMLGLGRGLGLDTARLSFLGGREFDPNVGSLVLACVGSVGGVGSGEVSASLRLDSRALARRALAGSSSRS